MDESNPLQPSLIKNLLKPLLYVNSKFTLHRASRNDLSAVPATRLSLGKRARVQQPPAAAGHIDSVDNDHIHQQEAATVEVYSQDLDNEEEEQQRRRQVCVMLSLQSCIQGCSCNGCIPSG
jgi:hypothetical protein